MNSLKIKLLGLITLIVVFIVSVSAYVTFELQKQMINQIAKHDTMLLAGTIQNGITNAMLSGHKELVNDILSRLRFHESIEAIRIYDETGRILNSSDSGEIGKVVTKPYLKEYGNGDPLSLQRSTSEQAFHTHSFIHNTPACHKCHDPAKKVLGILEIDLSLHHLDIFIDKIKNNTAIATLLIIVLIVVTITLFLIFYVDKPIRQLISSMQKVENGEFDSGVVIGSSNEMKLLSGSFNLMINKVKQLMSTMVLHERELAVAQEKLAHHHETYLMNRKLEEHLKEIENLNVSLEERIEEIEEANYKIADLAGELEDKNTNLERAVTRLSTLNKVGLAVNCTMELDWLFHLLVKTSMETMNAQIGYLLIYDHERQLFNVTTLLGHESTAPHGTILPVTPASVSAWVVKNRQPLLISNINETPQFDRFSALGYERKTLICVPLSLKEEIIGTMTVVNKHDNSVYTSEDLELLTTIAAQASVAIHNAKLYEDQQKNYLNTIQALVTAIEASDSYTRGHSERVTRYSLELAKMLDLSPERLKIVERAAMLHDIGKIGVDLALLHKEEELTSAERYDLQQHPLIGMKILEPIDFLQSVRICIGQHHERFDGQGYPSQVQAADLLLESRILAIADAYDAMTTDRPYRKRLAVDTALQELLNNAGSQFDPELVPHFVELVKSGAFAGLKPPTPPLPFPGNSGGTDAAAFHSH